MIGRTVGPYRILEEIGAGGMGVVFRAEDTRLGRQVALKYLSGISRPDDEGLKRFRQEARAASALNHPSICTIHDIADDDGAPFIVMELLEGKSLRQRLADGPLPLPETLNVAEQIADALDVAHEAGVIHRDIKPANIFLTKRGVAKLLDFGLAKIAPGPEALGSDAPTRTAAPVTESHTVMGTVPYMAPEQVRGERADERTDIFAFGVVLYEMLTGMRPFEGRTGMDTAAAILSQAPAPWSPALDVPGVLQDLVAKALAKAPDDRYQSMKDLLVDLRAASAPLAATRSAKSGASFLGIAGVGLLIAAGAWVAWTVFGGQGAPAAPAPAAGVPSPLINSEARERYPSWSPTGNQIAYTSNEDGNDDIWVCNPPSCTNQINLTSDHTGLDTRPDWSPDGQRIVFFSELDGPGLYVMTALGGSVQKIRQTTVSIPTIQWAGDDAIIYSDQFATGGGAAEYQVRETNVDGTVDTCLTCDLGLGGLRSGERSPSGQLLAFTTPPTRGARLYVLASTTGDVHEIATGGSPHWWGNDRLLFTATSDGFSDVWEVSVDPETGERTGEPIKVTSSRNVDNFAVGPNGSLLVEIKLDTSQLRSFPVQADPITSLAQGEQWTSGQFNDTDGSWASDGLGVYFTSDRRGASSIWRVQRLGADPEDVLLSSPRLRNPGGPRVSPKGDWVAFNAYAGEEERRSIHLMKPDGGNPHLFVGPTNSPYLGAQMPEWSPDGEQLSLTVWTDSAAPFVAIANVDRDTGKLDGVIRNLGVRGQFVRWSPDGLWLVFQRLQVMPPSLWLADVVDFDSSLRELTSSSLSPLAWLPDPSGLFFRRGGALWRLPIGENGSPGEPQRSVAINGFTTSGSVSVSPDGSHFLTSVIDPKSDIWLVER